MVVPTKKVTVSLPNCQLNTFRKMDSAGLLKSHDMAVNRQTPARPRLWLFSRSYLPGHQRAFDEVTLLETPSPLYCWLNTLS